MNNKLPKDFIVSDEYCVIQPGLTKFNKDQITKRLFCFRSMIASVESVLVLFERKI